MAVKKYPVDATFIKAAHKEACDEWKTKIEKKFPELFKPKEVFHSFGEQICLDSGWTGPLTIGFGLAPDGLVGKCLVVNKSHKMIVKEHNGYQVLVFKKIK